MGTTILQSTMSKTLAKAATVYKHWLERGKVKCFEEEQKAEKSFIRKEVGVQVIPMQQIVGSVGRCHDFDNQFRLQREHSAERLAHIKQMMRKGKILPPVELYKIKEEYYVLDGHHRVSAARDIGQLYIDAYVVEYRAPKERESILSGKVFKERALAHKFAEGE